MNPSQTWPDAPAEPLIPSIDPKERQRRNAAVLALIEEWANDEESTQDQRETMDVLRKALGPERIASNRAVLS
jgi:hypothetical protein